MRHDLDHGAFFLSAATAHTSTVAVPIRSAPPLQISAAAVLAFLAGSIDAVAFSMLGGLFVSFMSGNSTRLGVSLASLDMSKVAQIGSLILCFVAGAGCGSALSRTVRQPAAVLVVEAGLLCVAALVAQAGAPTPSACLMAAATGLENATFVDAQGETRINLTFMTGALVRLGEGLATACLGGPRWQWWPYFALWLGLTSGATAGAWSYARIGVATLPMIAAGLLGIAALLWRTAITAKTPD